MKMFALISDFVSWIESMLSPKSKIQNHSPAQYFFIFPFTGVEKTPHPGSP